MVAIPDLPDNRAYGERHMSGIQMIYFAPGAVVHEIRAKHQIIANGHFDLVHSFCVGLRSILAMRLIRHCGPPPIVVYDWDELMTAHRMKPGHVRLKNRLVQMYALQTGDGFTAASTFLHDYIRARGRKARSNVLLLPNGFDPIIDTRIEDSAAREVVKNDNAEQKLLYVGAISREYQVWELLDLAERIRSAKLKWKIFIAGEGPDRDEFARLCRERGLEGHISLLVWIPGETIACVLRVASILVFSFPPTLQNVARCPLKIYQYAASGVPIVTNRVGEVARALGDSGHYYAPGDAADMLAACRRASGTTHRMLSAGELEALTWEARGVHYAAWLKSIMVRRSDVLSAANPKVPKTNISARADD